MSEKATLGKGSRPRSQIGVRSASKSNISASTLKNQYEFGFDKVFIPGQSTKELYNKSVKVLLNKAMNQKTNFTLFLYG